MGMKEETWEDEWEVMPPEIVTLRLGMVAHVFTTSTQVNLCEFQGS